MEEEKEKQWVLVHTSSTMRSQELADEEARLRSSGFDVTILRDWQSDWAATVDCDKHFLVSISKFSKNYTKTDILHIPELVRDTRAKIYSIWLSVSASLADLCSVFTQVTPVYITALSAPSPIPPCHAYVISSPGSSFANTSFGICAETIMISTKLLDPWSWWYKYSYINI